MPPTCICTVVTQWCMHCMCFILMYTSYIVFLKSKAKPREEKQELRCDLSWMFFWLLSLMHYFKSKYFCYVQVVTAWLGKSHVHGTSYKVWYIQGCLFFMGFVCLFSWFVLLFVCLFSGWLLVGFFFSFCALYSADFGYYVLVLKRKLLLSVMCIMTLLSL